MTITLPPDYAALVVERVGRGDYPDALAVVTAGLHQLVLAEAGWQRGGMADAGRSDLVEEEMLDEMLAQALAKADGGIAPVG